MRNPELHAALAVAAEGYGGVLSRALLSSLGVTRHLIRSQIRAKRWVAHGRQTIALHTGELSENARRWRAVWEVGVRVAALDGVTALHEAGMTGYDDDRIHISVRHTHTIEPVDGVTIHKVRRRPSKSLAGTGIPRVRPAVAAVRAAHWAVSDRQAALLLCLPVQQRLIRPADLLRARRSTHGRTRRAFIDTVVRDITDGAHSLGELDFAQACRARGLSEPQRQVVRRVAGGRVCLDVRFDNGLVVEIDGSGHQQGLSVSNDNLRTNALQLQQDTVLRIDLVGWRLKREEFLDQVCAAFWMLQARCA